jgi:hypothetical protein
MNCAASGRKTSRQEPHFRRQRSLRADESALLAPEYFLALFQVPLAFLQFLLTALQLFLTRFQLSLAVFQTPLSMFESDLVDFEPLLAGFDTRETLFQVVGLLAQGIVTLGDDLDVDSQAFRDDVEMTPSHDPLRSNRLLD